jgi:hypothetical protein
MKYIEELCPGDTFQSNNKFFLLTSDFKKSGAKLAFSLQDGSAKWFDSQTIIETLSIYRLDNENNTIPLKVSYNVPNQITNIS